MFNFFKRKFKSFLLTDYLVNNRRNRESAARFYTRINWVNLLEQKELSVAVLKVSDINPWGQVVKQHAIEIDNIDFAPKDINETISAFKCLGKFRLY